MNISKTKINVGLGALTGLLVGLVFGVTLGSSDSSLGTSGAASGNVSMISRHSRQIDQEPEADVQKDTLVYTVIDEAGETWKVTMTK